MYVPMDTAGSACSNIVYHIGSANEAPGEYGLSHLLEHGMHFGSAKYNAHTKGGLITDMEMYGALGYTSVTALRRRRLDERGQNRGPKKTTSST